MQRSLPSFRAPGRAVAALAAVLVFLPAMALAPGAHASQALPGFAEPNGLLRSIPTLGLAAAGVLSDPETDTANPPTFDELADRCDLESTVIRGSAACRAAAFEYLTTKGLSAEHAAGVVGNLWVESNGVSPKSRQFGAGPGRGIAQWTYNQRWLGVLAMARARGVSPDTLRVQLDFLWKELTSTYRRALVDIRSAPTVHDATFAFQNKFEVPIGTAIGASPYTANLHPDAHTLERVQRARAVLSGNSEK